MTDSHRPTTDPPPPNEPPEGIDGQWFTADLRSSDAFLGALSALSAPPDMDPEAWARLQSSLRHFAREVAASVDPRRRAVLCHEIGRLLEMDSGDDRRAIDFYQRALRYDPTHRASLRASRRLLGRGGRWSVVLKLLDTESRVCADRANRARLLREKGDIYLLFFGAPAEALTCYRRAVGFWRNGVDAHRMAAHAAALAGDLRAEAASWEAGAKIVDHIPLRDAMRQLATYAWIRAGDFVSAKRASAAQEDETVSPLLDGVASLRHVIAGDWDAAVDVFRRIGGRGREWPKILVGLSMVVGWRGDAELARRLMKEARELVPEDDRTWLDATDRTHSNPYGLNSVINIEDPAERRVEVLLRAMETEKEAFATGVLLLEAGEVYAFEMEDYTTAADAWLRAITVCPPLTLALFALQGRLWSRGGHRALVDLLDAIATQIDDAGLASACWAVCGFLALDSLEDDKAASTAFAKAGIALRDSIGPLIGQERMALRKRSLLDLAEVSALLSDELEEGPYAAQFMVQRAQALEWLQRDSGEVFDAYEAALELDPEDPDALEWIEGWSHAAAETDLVTDLMERRLARATTVDERRRLLLQAGRLLHASHRLPEAARCYEALLRLDPDSPVSLRALRVIRQDLGQHNEATALAAREGLAAQHPANASALLLEVGRNHEQDPKASRRALEAYLEALTRDPADSEAAAAVRRICERGLHWKELAGALEGRAQGMPGRRASFLLEAAELYANRLDLADEARRCLSGLDIETLPTEAIHRGAQLCVDLEDWDRAGRWYERLEGIVQEAGLRGAIVLRLAAIYWEKLDNAELARHWLFRLVEDQPTHAVALARLAELEMVRGDSTAARVALARAVNAEERPLERARYRLRLAELDRQEDRLDVAAKGLVSALAEAPDDERIATHLARVRLLQGNAKAARRLAERVLSRVDGASEEAQIVRSVLTIVTDAESESAEVDSGIALALREFNDAPTDLSAIVKLADAALAAGETGWAARLDGLEAVVRSLGGEASISTLTEGLCIQWPRRPAGLETERRIWEGVDGGLLGDIRLIEQMLPAAFGGTAPAGRPVAGMTADLVRRIGEFLGWPEVTVRIAPFPMGVAHRDQHVVVVSRRVTQLPEVGQVFSLASALALARRRFDFVTRWRPDSLERLLATIGVAAGLQWEDGLGPRARQRAQLLKSALGKGLAERSVVEALERLHLRRGDIARAAISATGSSHRFGYVLCDGDPGTWSALRQMVQNDGIEGQLEEERLVSELLKWAGSRAFFRGQAALGFGVESEAV